MTCFSLFFAIIWQRMKKNTSWKFTDESSVTFQSSVSGPGEFGLTMYVVHTFSGVDTSLCRVFLDQTISDQIKKSDFRSIF